MFSGRKHGGCDCSDSCGGCASGCCGGSGGYSYDGTSGYIHGGPATMPKAGEKIPAPQGPAKKMPDGTKTMSVPPSQLQHAEPIAAPTLPAAPASPRTLDLGRSPY